MKNSLFLIFLAIGALTSCNSFKNAAFLTNNDLIRFIELNEAYQDSIKSKTISQGMLNNKGLNQSNTTDFDLKFTCPQCEALRAVVQGNCKPNGGPCLILNIETLRLIVLGPRTNPLPIANFSLLDNANGNTLFNTNKPFRLRNASGYEINLQSVAGRSFYMQVDLNGRLSLPLQINRPAPLGQ